MIDKTEFVTDGREIVAENADKTVFAGCDETLYFPFLDAFWREREVPILFVFRYELVPAAAKSHKRSCLLKGCMGRPVFFLKVHNPSRHKILLRNTVDAFFQDGVRLIHAELPWTEMEDTVMVYDFSKDLHPGVHVLLRPGSSVSLCHFVSVIILPISSILDENHLGRCQTPNMYPQYRRKKFQKPSQLKLSRLCSSWFPDFVIEAQGGHGFPCHRFILACRSEPMAAMLMSTFKENVEQRLRVENASPEAVSQFIKTLYYDGCCQPSQSFETLLDILILQHKYMVEFSCDVMKALASNLSLSNIGLASQVIFHLGMTPLHTRVVAFLFAHLKDVVRDGKILDMMPREFLRGLTSLMITCHHPSHLMYPIEEEID